MFKNAWSFNKDDAPWKVSAVTNFESMFSHAYQFNIDVSPWEVRSAKNMNDMFHSATVFNQKLCAWEQLPNFPKKAATNHMFELSSCPKKRCQSVYCLSPMLLIRCFKLWQITS